MTAADIAYVVFDHVDLDAAERFYLDYGLQVAYRTDTEIGFRPALQRGYCYVARKADKPGVVAIGMRMTSEQALQQASEFPEASAIEAIDRPGGGKKVSLQSPDGIPFELVYGIETYPALPVRDALAMNTGRKKVRFGEWQRPAFGPAAILRLGHVALLTNDFETNLSWMKSRLGMTPSDVVYDGTPEQKLGVFLHCGGTDNEWTDHHTLALFPSDSPRVHHCSFEIEDMDAQFLGNKWMESRGWKHTWGIGRHVFGSQIFDYWYDPAGNVAEHFTDGDLVRPGVAPEFHQADENTLFMWGPPIEVDVFAEAAAKHG